MNVKRQIAAMLHSSALCLTLWCESTLKMRPYQISEEVRISPEMAAKMRDLERQLAARKDLNVVSPFITISLMDRDAVVSVLRELREEARARFIKAITDL